MKKIVAFAIFDIAIAFAGKDLITDFAFGVERNAEAEIVYFNADKGVCELAESGRLVTLSHNQAASETVCASFNANGEILL